MFGFRDKQKTVSQEDLDMIRIKAEAMDSTNDERVLMEDLDKHIRVSEAELARYEGKDSDEEETKERDKLLLLRQDAKDIRQQILDYKIPPQRFGLFIKYPKDYEG